MLQAFIITLREGVEASLIVGIVFAYLTKIGRSELKRTVFWALGAAIAASVGGALVLARTQLNSDIFEGWVMLAAAFFVISMIWFMHKAARSMKGDIEQKISRYTTESAGVSKIGLFFFVFLLVVREGVETVLILSAVTLNSTELLSFTGTLAWHCGRSCLWRAIYSRKRKDQPSALLPRDDGDSLLRRVSADRQRPA